MSDLLIRKTKNKKAKRVGRGGTRGKTSGRGTKGQKARAGHRIRPHIRDTIKKLPKLRGRGKNSNKPFRLKAAAVNLAQIDAHFPPNARITPSALFKKGLVARIQGAVPMVKILATGKLTKPFAFYNCAVSAKAVEIIKSAGGTVNS